MLSGTKKGKRKYHLIFFLLRPQMVSFSPRSAFIPEWPKADTYTDTYFCFFEQNHHSWLDSCTKYGGKKLLLAECNKDTGKDVYWRSRQVILARLCAPEISHKNHSTSPVPYLCLGAQELLHRILLIILVSKKLSWESTRCAEEWRWSYHTPTFKLKKSKRNLHDCIRCFCTVACQQWVTYERSLNRC